MQRDSPLGWNSLVAARFYGLGNAAFAGLLAGTIVITVAVCTWVLLGWSRAHAGVAAFGILIFAVSLDMLPFLGADFGGFVALVIGSIVAFKLTARISLSQRMLVLLGLLVPGVLGLIAIADWMRGPGDWTHVGAQVDSLIQGEGPSLMLNRLQSSVRTLTNVPMALAAVLGLAAATLGIGRERADVSLTATAIASVIAGITNDSGLLLPAVAMAAVLPLASSKSGGEQTDMPRFGENSLY